MRVFKWPRVRRPLLIDILGSGPAGLFAAQAAYDAGHVVRIFARGEPSPLYGAQYLHAPIPNLDCGEPQTVRYVLKGTAESYRRKVYGDESNVLVSPEILSSEHQAWNIRSAYAEAWDRFGRLVRATNITVDWLRTGTGNPDLVVWSIPLAPFCLGGHQFLSQSVWAQGDAPELGRYCSVTVEPWTIVANGEDSPRWYRASNVFGHSTAEWPDGPKPPVQGLSKVDKPIQSNCTCWSKIGSAPVLRVGRYGTWNKLALSHNAYGAVATALKVM